ncbi:MAG: sigma-70 family RNA polymerase sigma factor [Propionibacteriaceae bacterium]|nr:sigma-70 family RNA polymerase sigma factor [Propionibacteriaceae bacterium]
MSTEGFDEFRARYESLVVTACEWRAIQANPYTTADDVFARLARHRSAPSLRLLYSSLQDAVLHAYTSQAGSQSFLDKMRGVQQELSNRPHDTPREAALRLAISSLKGTDRDLLQLALWDGLTPSEIAEVRRWEPDTVSTRIVQALGRFATLAAKRSIQLDAVELPATFRALKPGTHTRGE